VREPGQDRDQERTQGRHRTLVVACVIGLLVVFIAQLAVTVVRDSSTWDEGDHIYSGYQSWATRDFGLNPEHPPLIKLVTTTPLLGMRLNIPEPQDKMFMRAGFLGGKALLFESGNDAETILARTRTISAVLAVLLALVIFFGTSEMFGTWAGVFALAVWVFDPLAIAHGARVTTDTGASLCFFATTWAFYRYIKSPSVIRLALVGFAAGLSLATKHSGLFILPTLVLLAIAELAREWWATRQDVRTEEPLGRRALRLAGALVAAGVIAIAVLWASYGFRFAARPEGLALNPPFAEAVSGLSPTRNLLLSTAASWHVLPESYIYGLAAVLLGGEGYHSYALGTIYPHRVWFYFPLAFAIKTTLGFLGLVVLAVVAVGLGRMVRPREVLFLTIPPAFYFLFAMSSGMNIGVRHIMPVYVYLASLVGGAAWALGRANRRWWYVTVALLVLHVASTVKAFPNYMPYANEAWGGPSQTYRHLTDSSVDWAQQLKSVKRYCDERGVKDGWFAYFGQGVLEPRYYGIPLKPLPTADSLWIGERIQVPPAVDGPVFISAGVLAGWEFGPGALDPYAQFRQLKPIDVIDDTIFVFDGHFEIPLAAALGHAQSAAVLLAENKPDAALIEAQAAVALAPESVSTQSALGDALAALGRKDDARSAYARALDLSKTVEPAFQEGWVPGLEQKLAGGGS
jgi:dolichyl-phosphate-mannose-protein mannosyltransferase